ncbi:MAG: ABC transporter permease subunit [Friedmanniella sp.]
MTRLLRAELLRLRSRRMTLFAAILLLVAVALFQLAVNEAVTPPSGAEVAAAQREYEQSRQDWEANHQQYEQDCRDEGLSEQQCVIPAPVESDLVPQAASFATMADVGVYLVAVLVMLTGYLLGASLLGAEVSTGSMANWLTFVPRRGSVLAAKLLVLAAATAVAAAVLLALTLALTALLVRMHGGVVTGVPPLVAMSGRAVVLAMVAAVLGACLALLTRHTVAALGIILGYVVVSGVLSALMFTVPALSELPPWLPQSNLTAFLRHGSTYEVIQPFAEGGATLERRISFAHAAVYWAVLTAVVIAATALVFRRRDVN